MNKHRNTNFLYNLLGVVYRFTMQYLDVFLLCFALQYWFDAGNSWKYWLTMLLFSITRGISIAWCKNNNC